MFDSIWIYEKNEAGKRGLLERIISSRGLPTGFIENDGIEFMHDPFSMNGMESAVQRIVEAYKYKQKTVVFGDYDADGITSSAMLVKFFRKMNMHVDYIIPDRFSDGYGLGPENVDQLIKLEPDLVITADCGINSVDEVNELKNSGVDVIITDHHNVSGDLPKAKAMLCCTRNDNTYPFDYLSGAGVALKLIKAVTDVLKIKDSFVEYLPLAALGTIADIVPLVDENRIIVKQGIEMIKKGGNPAIEAIFKSISRDFRKIDSTQIAYWVAPLLNAAGRMGSPQAAMSLLLEEDYVKACKAAEELNELNLKRRAIQERVYRRIREILSSQKEITEQKVIVIADEDLHKGIIGIAASKISNDFNRPAIIFSVEGEAAQGSGRSVEGFSLVKALEHCSDLLLNYGGHDAAAGLNIECEKIGEFRKRINDYASESECKFQNTKTYKIDTRIFEDEINIDSFQKINCLEPFGEGNPQPLVLIEKVVLQNKRMVGNTQKHMSFAIRKGESQTNCIFFNSSGATPLIESGTEYDIVASPVINEYRGKREARFNVIDIKLSDTSTGTDDYLISRMLVDMLIYRKANIEHTVNSEDFVKYLRSTGMNMWAEKTVNGEFDCGIERSQVGIIYKHLRDRGEYFFDIREFDGKPGIHKTYLAFEILKELGIVKAIDEGFYGYRVSNIKKKGGRKLETSRIYEFVNSVV